ncbi:hypothetical protein T492DRAFT_880137 [Pavlovales sp. CCMP2436]|nr:hypothetical protein T492DRAFT_880137 [Pavlovales sp. CCMP2436]
MNLFARAWREQPRGGAVDEDSAFGRTNWTSIVFVRDLWTRAISSYRDYINRKIVKLRGTSRDDFLAFTRRQQGNGHHTACAVDSCGLRQPGSLAQ